MRKAKLPSDAALGAWEVTSLGLNLTVHLIHWVGAHVEIGVGYGHGGW